MVSHEEIRKQRIYKINRTISDAHENGKILNREKLIAICCFEWGSTRRTILEYMKIVELTSNLDVEWDKK